MRTVLTAALLTLALAHPALAEGAIAFADVPRVGYSGSLAANYATAQEARQQALAGCRRGTNASVSTCRVVATLRRQCAALAAGRKGAAWAIAATQEAAAQRALKTCSSRSVECRIAEQICDTRS
jgi:hypothetical protein